MTLIRPFTHLEARLVEFEWRWADENAERIAEHWRGRCAAQPALFNGRNLMVSQVRLEDDRLVLDMFETDYARLLAHIDFGFPDPGVQNGFAMGALKSRDGAFILGRMAPHTASAGRLYFPAGTPDLNDVRPDRTVDLAGSILREISEETGLDLGPADLAATWTLVREGGRAALMRGVSLDRDADEIRDRIVAFLARDAQPELSEIVILRDPGDIDEDRMPPFLPPYLRWAFAQDGTAQR